MSARIKMSDFRHDPGEPKDDLQFVLQGTIHELWKKVKPSYDAQVIRSKLFVSFDSEKSGDRWISDPRPPSDQQTGEDEE